MLLQAGRSGDDRVYINIAKVNQAHSIGKFRMEPDGAGDRDFLGDQRIE
ncbi:hypothetical protein [Thalassospira xiamenensis]|nr:hypothetical protein [Thalassospira xiamenensis]